MPAKKVKPELTWADVGEHLDEIARDGNFHLEVVLHGTGATPAKARGVAVSIRAREWTIHGPGKIISQIQFHYPNKLHKSLTGALYAEAVALSCRVEEKRAHASSGRQTALWAD